MNSDWLLQNADQLLARQRSQIDSAKLIVSITIGVSATLVGTALQVSQSTIPGFVSVAVLFVMLATSVVVVLLDRMLEPNRLHVEEVGRNRRWDDARKALYMRCVVREAEKPNIRQVRLVQLAAGVHVALSLFCSYMAILSLLGGQR